MLAVFAALRTRSGIMTATTSFVVRRAHGYVSCEMKDVMENDRKTETTGGTGY